MSIQTGCDDGKPPTFFENHPNFWPSFWVLVCVGFIVGSLIYGFIVAVK